MITLTPTAASMLSNAREQQEEIPNDATLRIAPSTADAQPGSISLGFVDDPFDGDQTAETEGLAYCVAPEVAEQLDGATIDVQRDGEEVRLVVVPAS